MLTPGLDIMKRPKNPRSLFRYAKRQGLTAKPSFKFKKRAFLQLLRELRKYRGAHPSRAIMDDPTDYETFATRAKPKSIQITDAYYKNIKTDEEIAREKRPKSLLALEKDPSKKKMGLLEEISQDLSDAAFSLGSNIIDYYWPRPSEDEEEKLKQRLQGNMVRRNLKEFFKENDEYFQDLLGVINRNHIEV